MENIRYEFKPYFFLLFGIFAVLQYGDSSLMGISGGVLVVAALLILQLRSNYRREFNSRKARRLRQKERERAYNNYEDRYIR